MLTTLLAVAGTAAAAYAIYRWFRPPKPQDEKSEDENEPQDQEPPHDPGFLERVRKAREQAQQEAAAAAERDRIARQAVAAQRAAKLTRAIETLTDRLSFSARKEWVGRRKIGEAVVGHLHVEGEIPDVGFTIRPMYDLSEISSLMTDEYVHDDDEFYRRLGMGESLVVIPIERHEIREPVFDDVYKEVVQVVYTLIDVSGSMFERHAPWRPPVWKPLLRRIVHKARERSAAMMLRPFAEKVLPLERADTNGKAYDRLIQFIEELADSGGTKIGHAISIAIRDVTSQEFDHADIIIVSDGEDENFDPVQIRAKLDSAGIRLHAIMLGAKNAGLQACADEYQIIDEDLTVHPPVIRTKKVA